jgi:hypothetical protein
MTSRAEFPWAAPAEHERAWITIELDYPTSPWQHDGAGSITWGANFHRLAPLGEEAVSIIREAWEQRQGDGSACAATLRYSSEARSGQSFTRAAGRSRA